MLGQLAYHRVSWNQTHVVCSTRIQARAQTRGHSGSRVKRTNDGSGKHDEADTRPPPIDNDSSDLAEMQAVASQNYRGFPELFAPF